ncbi:MAG: outer membrane beta-barrel protein [Woeseiaceae bacterium]
MSNGGLLAACVALALWTSTASAQVQRGFFASVNIGSSETSFHPASVARIDDREQSFDVGIGYAFGPYLAIQGTWHDYGQTTGFVVCPPEGCMLAPGECPPGSVCVVFMQPVPVQVDVSGWSARLTGSLPLGSRFAAFASVGVIDWDTSADAIVTLPDGRRVDDLDDSGNDLVYSAGLQWHVSDRWSLQAFYEHVDLDIESSKLGATFRF